MKEMYYRALLGFGLASILYSSDAKCDELLRAPERLEQPCIENTYVIKKTRDQDDFLTNLNIKLISEFQLQHRTAPLIQHEYIRPSPIHLIQSPEPEEPFPFSLLHVHSSRDGVELRFPIPGLDTFPLEISRDEKEQGGKVTFTIGRF